MSITKASIQGPFAPLRVLMINTVPMAYEGITMVMLNYASNMARKGLQIDFVAINDVEDTLRQRIEAMGSRLFVIPHRNRNPLGYVLRLSRLVRKGSYDVVHAHGNSCTLVTEMFAARLGGARVRCPHSHNTTCNSVRLNDLLRPAFDRSYTQGFACGEAAGRWLFGSRPFVVLNNGVDTARYAYRAEWRADYRRALGIGHRTAIGHVANFSNQKNHRFLVEAFERAAARNPNLILVLVGDGPNRAEIERMVEERNLSDRVRLLGRRIDVPQILSAMDFMVLPSLFEGLPNVLIEWQASGLRALVADTVTEECRLTELIRFLPLEAETWAGAMLDMETEYDREQSSARARKEIAQAGYDIRESAERLRRLYFEYAGGRAPED